MAGGEDGDPVSVQPRDVQAGVLRHGEKGGALSCGAVQAADAAAVSGTEGRGTGAQAQQNNLVLLAAGAGECSGNCEGVPSVARAVSGKHRLRDCGHRREELAKLCGVAGLRHSTQGEETDSSGSFCRPAEAGAADTVWRDVD